jgi:hypothetical protein
MGLAHHRRVNHFPVRESFYRAQQLLSLRQRQHQQWQCKQPTLHFFYQGRTISQQELRDANLPFGTDASLMLVVDRRRESSHRPLISAVESQANSPVKDSPTYQDKGSTISNMDS